MSNQIQPQRIDRRAEKIRGLIAVSAGNIIEIGKELLAAKDEIPHGEFSKWVEHELSMQERTAQRFMAVARKFQDRRVIGFDPTALYLLASPSVPDAAIDAAIETAEQGEQVDSSKAQELIEEHAGECEATQAIGKTDTVTVLNEPDSNPSGPDPCPNCGNETWGEDEDGLYCLKCQEPAGEEIDDQESPDSKLIVQVLDKRKKPVPQNLAGVFHELHYFNESRDLLKKLNTVLDSIANGPAGRAIRKDMAFKKQGEIYRYYSTAASDIRQLLNYSEPYAPCGYCGGSGCDACQDSGWLTKDAFENSPKEYRERV